MNNIRQKLNSYMLTKHAWIKYIRLICILLATSLCSCSSYLDGRDYSLRKHFNEQYDTFVQLEQLLRKDTKIGRMTTRHISIYDVNNGNFISFEKSGISPSKIQSYLSLINKADIERFQRLNNTGNPIKIEFSDGFGSFGFTYRETIPVKEFKSLNACRAIKFDDKYRCYVFLRKNWYLHMGPMNDYGESLN